MVRKYPLIRADANFKKMLEEESKKTGLSMVDITRLMANEQTVNKKKRKKGVNIDEVSFFGR